MWVLRDFVTFGPIMDTKSNIFLSILEIEIFYFKVKVVLDTNVTTVF